MANMVGGGLRLRVIYYAEGHFRFGGDAAVNFCDGFNAAGIPAFVQHRGVQDELIAGHHGHSEFRVGDAHEKGLFSFRGAFLAEYDE